MTRVGRRQGWWLIALGVFATCAALRVTGGLQSLDNAFADHRARWLSHEVHSDIVIVGIDDAGLAALDQWPWPRRHHARLLEQLNRSAPHSVFLDVDLSSLAAPVDDMALEIALNQPRDFPVFLPAFLHNASGTDTSQVAFNKPRPRFAERTERAIVSAVPGRDGLVRTWRTSWNLAGAREPTIVDRDRRLPDEYDVIIDYSIAPRSFAYVSYVDALEGRVPREVFAGKHVFIGAVAEELHDTVPVPLHRSLPGVVVQALASETVQRGAPRPLSVWADLVLLALWIGAVAFAFARRGGARWRRNFAVAAIALGGIGAFSFYAFQIAGYWVGVAAPALAVCLLFIAGALSSLEKQTWRAVAYALGIRRSDALFKSIVQSSTDCIVCVDERGIIRTANPAASRLFDCPAYELLDEPISKFITLLAGDDVAARLGALHGVIRECDARTARGEMFPVEISVSRVRVPADRLYTAVVRDIRERRAQQRRLQHQGTHDSLSGLPDRAALITAGDTTLTGLPPRPGAGPDFGLEAPSSADTPKPGYRAPARPEPWRLGNNMPFTAQF